ncbi:hypothetical protein PGC34_11195 [Pseudomonas kribbensis]|uniref:hypothetical protein n=1 Tax=Pseudomonas kribbensis TaxID=1628086 RepID=UPI003BF92081
MNINVNSTQADSALALLPMFVPGALTSVQPTGFAHLGAPLVIYPATTGLAMVIDPVTTLSTTLTAFDTVVIWLNGQPTSAIKIIQPGEENDRILMYLPPGLLVNGINTMFYRVTRPSGNFEDSTPILNVLFNNPAPNITVSHPASIGPGQPAVITLTVGYARPYDTVTLTIGTWSITFTNPDPTKPITHTLTAAELQQIGDGTHSVSARVIDQLTNSNVSPTTSITISANQKVYNPPIIVEGEPGKILDVAALNGKDATIHGLTWTRIASGQQVWLKLAGHKPDGSTVTLQIWNGGGSQVNATWVSQGFWPKPLPASFLALLADASSLRMEFWVSEDKSNNFATATKFADQVYTIKAEALVDPIIEKVNENTALGALVPDGESTYATTLVISGTASAGRQLQVLKNGAVIDTITVSVTGTFSYTHADATLGARSYTIKGLYGTSPVSTPWYLTVKVDTWRDSIVDFNGGNPGGWVMGPASRTARFMNGYYENLTYDAAGNRGVILRQSFQLEATRTYRLTYQIANVSPQPENVPPVISVATSSGVAILNPFSVPRTNSYYQQTANFRVNVDGVYTIEFFNHEDRGGYGGAQGGNDYYISSIYVQRL